MRLRPRLLSFVRGTPTRTGWIGLNEAVRDFRVQYMTDYGSGTTAAQLPACESISLCSGDGEVQKQTVCNPSSKDALRPS